jgi:hypothetical protein
MKILNFKIFKEDIKNRQDLITEFFHITNIYELNSKLNKRIYKELLFKFNRFIF